MPNGGKVTIKTSSASAALQPEAPDAAPNPEKVVEVSISDTGVGMTQEIQAHLFEPFFTTKAQGQGSGLGLSSVYGIVQQSNGNIWVSSEPGQGTTFTMSFPGLGAEAIPEREVLPAKVSPGKETILLAEDELGVRNYVRKMLERHGYTVVEAANGEEALDLARASGGSIRLLLTDLVMPLMGGIDLMEKFGTEFPHVPVLFMSAYTDQIMRHWNVLSAYIQKPFHIADLLGQIRELLDRAAAESMSARNTPSAK
jgi:CheY-like chemotaxis protein